MSAPDLNAIRARAAAATKGPWVPELPDPDDDWAAEESSVYLDDGMALGTAYIAREISQGDEGKAGGEFIAHARQDIPDLCDKVDELGGALTQAMSALSRTHGDLATAAGVPEGVEGHEDVDYLCEKIAGAMAENGRLRAVISEVEKLHPAEDGEWCCEDPECENCVTGGAHEGKVCWTCSNGDRVYQHPCPTVRALGGGE